MFVQSYLGLSPPPSRADAGPQGPHASLSVILDAFTQMSPGGWPLGVRTAGGSWPTDNTPTGTHPNINDVLAVRFLNFIAPGRDGPSSIHRARFLEVVTRGLSVYGLYERLTQRGGWVASSRPLEHYPFDVLNVSIAQALAWVHRHGIPPGSPESHALHLYAASSRNRRDGNSSPLGQEFCEEPQNTRAVLSWDDGLIPDWRVLQHGPVRAGITTTSMRMPAGEADIEMTPAATPAPISQSASAEPGEIVVNEEEESRAASNVTNDATQQKSELQKPSGA
ncbi:hypothetical protein B0H12DRAFT_1234419 [Mycena haematopus]|nr:hypothetical protein B0H12DRAFT_1234419 [Mycena haematopus]